MNACPSTTTYTVQYGDDEPEVRAQECELPDGHDGDHEGGWFGWPNEAEVQP